MTTKFGGYMGDPEITGEHEIDLGLRKRPAILFERPACVGRIVASGANARQGAAGLVAYPPSHGSESRWVGYATATASRRMGDW